MPRPTKIGIDYFPLDVDFFHDEKIQFVSARFGVKGEIIAIRLLCKIYRNGYYTEWNEDESTLFAKRVGDNVSYSLVNDVVNELVRRGFFDKIILDRFAVLTSKGIQKIYATATSERKEVEIKPEFWLIDFPKNGINSINRPINSINRPINSINPPISTQSKVNKNKFLSPYNPPKGGKENEKNEHPVDARERKEKVARKRKELDLSFVEPSFQPIMADWLSYKSERGQTYRQKGVEACYQRLLELSNRDAAKARLIVEQSKANNWAGLFELKQAEKHGNPARNYQQGHRDAQEAGNFDSTI